MFKVKTGEIILQSLKSSNGSGKNVSASEQ